MKGVCSVKKKGILILIVLVLVVAAVGALFLYSSRQDTIDFMVRKYMEANAEKYDPSDYAWSEAYPKVRGSKDLEKALLEAFEANESINMEQLADTCRVMEYTGLQSEAIKEHLDEQLSTYIALCLTKGNIDYLVESVTCFSGLSFYSDDKVLLSDEMIIDGVSSQRTAAYASENAQTIMEFAWKVEQILGIKPSLNPEDLLPRDEFVDYFKSRGFVPIYQNGLGGYYDGKESNTEYYKDDTQASVYKSHDYFGDFMASGYSKTAYRPTGEDWEDELLNKYDEESSNLYYRDKKISNSYHEFVNAMAANPDEVYMWDNYVICIKGNTVSSVAGYPFIYQYGS